VASATSKAIAAIAPVIPEANYYLSALGTRLTHLSGTAPVGFIVQVERLVAEGGIAWEVVYQDQVSSDSESGMFFAYSQMKSLFYRWPGDIGSDRMNVETARRWRLFNFAVAGWSDLTLLMTYHSITYTCADSISGFTGTVDIRLARSDTGERVLETTRVGDGAFSFTWYDNTELMFVTANDGTNVGRSQPTLAS
jgi:hypothetical protein